MQTRYATLLDIPFLLEQLWSFDDFCGTKHSLISPVEGEATEVLAQLITNSFFKIVETEKGRMVGFICGILTPHILNPKLNVFTELFWWVMEEARGTAAGALLLLEFVEFGKNHAQWTIMTLEEHSPVKPESLEKRGFKLKERNYLLEV